MNRVYKVIWSKVKNCYIVASELAKSKTKAPKSGVMSHFIGVGMLSCILSSIAMPSAFSTALSLGGGKANGVNTIAIGQYTIANPGGSNTNNSAFAFGMGYAENHSVILDTYTYGTSSNGWVGSAYDYSVAIGYGNTAGIKRNSSNKFVHTDGYDLALGGQNYAIGGHSNAIGFQSTASGNYATALGFQATASGSGAIAVGGDASGSGSIAIGKSFAYGSRSVAIAGGTAGGSSSSPTNYNIAVGYDSVASAVNSVALGRTANSSASGAVALGYGSVADTANTVSVGSSSTKRKIVNVANGTAANDAATFGQIGGAIKGLSVSGKTVTYTKIDGTTGTITTQDTDTTYNAFTGASSTATGTSGLVKAPAAGDQDKFLRGDGTWATDNNTTYSAGTGLSLSGTTFSINTNGSIASGNTGVLNGGTVYSEVRPTADGTFAKKANTTAANITALDTAAKNAIKGLSVSGTTITYTKGDGTTGTITTQDNNTTYSAGTGLSLSGTSFSVNTNGTIASGNAGVLNGGTVFTEVRPTADGTFAKKANTTAANITALDTAAKNAIKGLSVSGKTITYTKGDGTTGTITTQDTNTTYNAFTGATASAAGTTGLVTAPAKGQQGYVLHGDGTWSADKDTTYSAMSADELTTGTATTSRAVTAKVVSDYVKGKTDDKITNLSVNGKVITYTKGDGTTGTITTQDTNTTYSAMSTDELTTGTATTGRTMTAKVVNDYVKSKTDDKLTGLTVSGKTITYMKGDGSTGTITTQDTTYGAGTTALLNTGTDTTNKVWTSKALADYVKGESRITADGTFAKKANTAAANITALDTAAKNAIKGLSVSGKVITYTKGDGTTGTITTQDTNTTYNAFTGASASAAGTIGLVTAPAKGQQGYVLHGDGTWSADKDTTYSALSASELTTGTATTARSVTAKVLNDYVKSKTDDKITSLSVNGKTITYTKGDGTTGTITTQDNNTTYSAMGADELSTGTATTSRTMTAKIVNDYVKGKTDDKLTGLSVSGKTITFTKGDGSTGTITTQDTTYSGGTASVLSTGTETTNKLWSSKVLSDFVKGKVDTEANTRSTADTALDNRIGTLTANGYYVKKSATNNMATNMTLLDYQLKATNDNITGFASDITRNKNNISNLNTSVSSALSSVSAASSVIDLLSNTKADASLANLNASGKRVIATAAMNAVQEYMASQGGVATPSAPMMYNNGNSNGLTVNDAGNGSLHVGEGSYVNGTSSIAIGVGNQVNANNAGAFGDPSIINADASYVLGNDDTVNTGAVGSFIVGNDSVSSAKGGLTFGSNNNLLETAEDSIALGNNVSITGKNSIALGSSSTATEDNIVSVGNNNLKRRITNVADGNVAEDSTDVITGSQLFETNEKVKANENAIAQKADTDASNINVDNWAAKLGIGSVEDGNIGLVNGGTVFNAIQKVQDNQFVQQNGDVLSIGGNTGGNTINVANNAGDGRIITGVVTDPENPYSAANVGYVQSVSENIVNAVNQGFTKVDSKINKVGANAAALASLTPASFEGDEKWSLGASFGHYEGETAGAVGAFYKPTENVMLNLRGAFASGENMFGGGVAVSLSKGDVPGVTKRQLAVTVNKQATAINQLQQNMEVMRNSYESRISELESKMQEMAKQINTNK